MNCKPGVLAVVLRPTSGGTCDWTGQLVEVVAPLMDRQLYPDVGLVDHKYPAEHDEWLCRVIGPRKEALIAPDGRIVYSSYGRMWDHRLRPLPGGESPEESTEAMKRLHDTTVPAKKKEPVVRPFQWEAL